MEQILLLITLVIFIIYNVYMTYLNGWKLPESISETSYISKERFGTTVPFSLMCILCIIGILPIWMLKSPEIWQFLVFFSCGGMLFAGATPLFKERFEAKIHYTSGIIAFTSGILWLCVTHYWLSIGTIISVSYICSVFNKSKFVFIYEVIGFIVIAITLLT